MKPEILSLAANIELVVFDVDGVFTDGRLYLGHGGKETLKVFHARDGHGIKLLLAANVQVAIISGRSSPIVSERMNSLGVKYVYQGCDDKRPVLHELADKLMIDKDKIAYVGDDTLDLPALTQVGLGIAVADGHPSLKTEAHWTTHTPGGRGAVREVCDLILSARSAGS